MIEIERLRRLRAYVPLSREAVDLWNDIKTFSEYIYSLDEVSTADYRFYRRLLRDFRERIESLVYRVRAIGLLYQPIDPNELKRAKTIRLKITYKPHPVFEAFFAYLIDILDFTEMYLESLLAVVKVSNLEIRITASCETAAGHQPIAIPEIHASTIIQIRYSTKKTASYNIEYVDAETGESFFVDEAIDMAIKEAEEHVATELTAVFMSKAATLLHALMIKEGAEHILTTRRQTYPSVEIEGEYVRYQKGKFKMKEFAVAKGNIRDWLK